VVRSRTKIFVLHHFDVFRLPDIRQLKPTNEAHGFGCRNDTPLMGDFGAILILRRTIFCTIFILGLFWEFVRQTLLHNVYLNMKVEITSIKENKRPVRTVHENTVEFLELMDSIGRLGQLTPILINHNHIIDGHQRVLAAKRLGWVYIDATTKELSPQEELVAQIVLNNLSLIEYRLAITRLIDENSLDRLDSVGYTLGRSIEWVVEILGLRTLSPIVRNSVNNGRIHIKAAILLSKLPQGEQQKLLVDTVNLPISKLLPKLQQEVRHRYERKLDTRSSKRGGYDTPYLRSERAVLNELNLPIEAMRIITKENVTKPLEIWQLALRWALRLDSESLETRRYQIER